MRKSSSREKRERELTEREGGKLGKLKTRGEGEIDDLTNVSGLQECKTKEADILLITK